jgi:hypothetical protein
MDIYSVLTEIFTTPPRRHRMTAREEDLYYARASLPDLSWVRLGSLSGFGAICIVLVVGVVLL